MINKSKASLSILLILMKYENNEQHIMFVQSTYAYDNYIFQIPNPKILRFSGHKHMASQHSRVDCRACSPTLIGQPLSLDNIKVSDVCLQPSRLAFNYLD